MNQVILNQNMVNLRKEIKRIQRKSMRGYCRGKSSTKTKIGKLIRLVPTKTITDDKKSLNSDVNLDRMLKLLESNNFSGMSGNGFSVKAKIESLISNNSPKFFIINGVECEPGLVHDEWLIENHWES